MEKVTKNVQSQKKRKSTRRFVSRQFGEIFSSIVNFVLTTSISEILRGFDGLLNTDFQCLKFLFRRLRVSWMRKLSAPVRFLQKLHVYVFFIFLRSPQYGVFTQVAFDTAKRRREQFISIFRTSRESQKHTKIKKQLKGFCLLRNVAKILAISCNAQNDPRW